MMKQLYQHKSISDEINITEVYRFLLSHRAGNEPFSEIIITSFDCGYNDILIPGIDAEEVEEILTDVINFMCNKNIICDRAWGHKSHFRCVNILWDESGRDEWDTLTKDYFV